MNSPGRKPILTGKLIIASQDYSVSLSLIFDCLPVELRSHLRLLNPSQPPVDAKAAVMNADAVILSRSIHVQSFQALASFCVSVRKNFYYYTDDNFWELADERPEFDWFNGPECRAFLKAATGIIVTSDNLEQYCKEFNSNILRFNPAQPDGLQFTIPPRNSALTVAFIGSRQRSRAFSEFCLPAIASMQGEKIVYARDTIDASNNFGVKIQTFPSTNFSAFLSRYRSFAPDILMHPPADSPNSPYKTANAILVSYLIGAVPIVSDEVAYSGLGFDEGVFMASTKAEWLAAMEALSDKACREKAYQNLTVYCHHAFSSSTNEKTIKRILKI